MVQCAFDAGVRCTDLFVDQTSLGEWEAIVARWKSGRPDMRIHVLAESAIAKLQYGDRCEKLIAVAECPNTSIESLELRIAASKSLSQTFLILDRIEKPGNLGAMLRSADAAGVQAVLLSDPICETWNSNAIRSSLGAIFHVPIAAGTQVEIESWLSRRGIKVCAARVEGTISYTEFQFPDSIAIAVGNEAEGLADRWQGESIVPLRIPMRGQIDSLNASISASLFLFEIERQRSVLRS